MAPAVYGVLLGITFVAVDKLAPQPAGAVILWSVIGIHLAFMARICWRRTGLPFATAAILNSAMMSVCLVMLALVGQPFPHLAAASFVFVVAGGLSGGLLLLIESRLNRPKWAEWRRSMEDKRLSDLLTGRHFPDLRKGGA